MKHKDDCRVRYATNNKMMSSAKYKTVLQEDGRRNSEDPGAFPQHTSLDISDDDTDLEGEGLDLHGAVTLRKFALCKRLISRESINLRDGQDSSPLHILARKYSKKKQDASKILHLLLQEGAKISARDKEGNTPLHIAAREGHDEFCAQLIDHQKQLGLVPEINVSNTKNRMTPLHLAAQQGQSKVIELLLKEGADPSISDCHGYIPLHHAAEGGYPEGCKLLSHSYSEQNQNKSKPPPPLMLAARRGHSHCCENLRLSQKDLDYQDKQGNTALHVSSKKGYDRFVLQLLAMGASLDLQNKEGNTPIMDAISRYSVSCLAALKDNGAKLNIMNKRNRGVLHIAADKKADECMALLLTDEEVKTNIDEKDSTRQTPFIIALRKDCDKCTIMLLEAGADPTIECAGKLSPLHWATVYTRLHLLHRLLKTRGIDINAKEEDLERTPLHFAAKKGSREACMVLLRKGARIDATDKHGETPLHVAAYCGHSSVVKLLIKKEAKIRMLSDMNSTPLHAAAASGDLESCQVLVKADQHLCLMPDVQERYPHDIAFRHAKNEIFEFLLRKIPCNSLNKLPKAMIKNLHTEMHKALKEENRNGVETIVRSPWCCAGFFVNRLMQHERTVCHNFRQTIKQYPDLAGTVMDRCIISPSKANKYKIYNFRLLEDNYHIKEDIQKQQKAVSGRTNTLDREEELDPYHPETGELKPNVVEFIQDPLEWKKEHPLSIMAKYNRLKLIEHPLVEKWLLHKWQEYARRIYMCLLFVQVFFVVTLGAFLCKVYNETQVKREFNVTPEILCGEVPPAVNITDTLNNIMDAASANSVRWSFTFLLISTFFMCIAEGNSISKLHHEYFRSISNNFKVLSLLLTCILLFTYSSCFFWIKSATAWECGIWAFLLSTASLSMYMNKHPSCAFFSSFSHSSVKAYLKIALFAAIIILAFAFTFHLLLNQDHEAFVSVPQSIVKTVVWMLGDLAYDESFTKFNLTYPVLTNIFFLLFICTVSGFIISLIKAPATDSQKLILLKAKSNVDLFLTIDVCFPKLRRKHVTGKCTDEEKKPWLVSTLEHLYYRNSKRPFLSNKLYSLVDTATLQNVTEKNKPWIIKKVEDFNKCFTLGTSEDDNYPLPNQMQEKLEEQNLKLDQLLTLFKQLNHSYQIQSEQITELRHYCSVQNEQIAELKQQLQRQKRENSWDNPSYSNAPEF